MAPIWHFLRGLDVGSVGDDVSNAANSAVDGASGAAETAQGAVATATSAAGGAVATATQAVSGAVSSATSAYADATGMLGMLNKIETLISTLEGYWDTYKIYIEIGICAFIGIVALSILYCCFHCWFDCFHYCCCYLKCTWHCERWCWRHRGPCVSCCRSCCNKEIAEKEWHCCTRGCLGAVPKHVRDRQERLHGDLREGWCDMTHCLARRCGRVELSNDPQERAKWHWWGHQDLHYNRKECVDCLYGWARDSAKRLTERLEKEVDKAQKRNMHWSRLAEKRNEWGEKVGPVAHDGINRAWAENVGILHKLNIGSNEKSNPEYDERVRTADTQAAKTSTSRQRRRERRMDKDEEEYDQKGESEDDESSRR